MLDVDTILQRLCSAEAKKRAGALQALERDPTGDARVRSEVERLLDDTTILMVGVPIIYADVRFLAAEALAAERKKAGIREVVHFDQIGWPLTPQELADATRAAGIPFGRGGNEGDIERFRALRAAGKLPMGRYDNPSPWLGKKEQAIAAVRGAVRASQEGRPIEETCRFCAGLLTVTPVPDDRPTQWLVSCPCGESSATIKGS
jgi:hypothetical protein